VLAAFALLTSACEQLVDPPGDGAVRYRDEVFAAVDVTADVPYGSAVDQDGTTVDLYVDIYEPRADPVAERPLLVLVHGGGFTGGSRTSGSVARLADEFAHRGYVTASISYRLDSVGCGTASLRCLTAITQAREDAQAAVAWLRSHATTYGIDTDRVAIAGNSAGAITAVNVAWSNDDPSSSVDAAVSFAGAAIGSTPEPGDADVFLFHGTADTTVPVAWAQNTATAAEAVEEVRAVMTIKEGTGHGVFGAHTAEAIEQTRNFLWWQLELADASS